MSIQELSVSYWDKEYLDSQFPENTQSNTPYFQLAAGDISSPVAISRQEDFLAIVLETLKHLKQPASLQNTYQIKFSESASVQITETGKKVLEEILALHNDLVTPKRS